LYSASTLMVLKGPLWQTWKFNRLLSHKQVYHRGHRLRMFPNEASFLSKRLSVQLVQYSKIIRHKKSSLRLHLSNM
jgi:hypothetical protein